MQASDNIKNASGNDPARWTAAEFSGPGAWEQHWTPAMLAEIRGATERVRHLAPWDIRREDFSLPVCAPLLAQTWKDLDQGRGFAVIAGFPVDDYDYDDAVRAYSGVSAHLGNVVAQTSKQERLVDVTDRGKAYDGNSRGYQSNKLLPFHSDGSYLVGLFCLETARQGGESILASSVTACHRVLQEDPELMVPLMRGYFHDRRGDHLPGEHPVSRLRIPVFEVNAGLLHCRYNRNAIVWAQDKSGEPLSSADTAALDALDRVIAEPQHQIRMNMKKGDMQFLNNFVILHSRTSYLDYADHRRRHLVRLWLDCPQGRRRGLTRLAMT